MGSTAPRREFRALAPKLLPEDWSGVSMRLCTHAGTWWGPVLRGEAEVARVAMCRAWEHVCHRGGAAVGPWS